MLNQLVVKGLHIQMNLNVFLLWRMRKENFQEKFYRMWF